MLKLIWRFIIPAMLFTACGGHFISDKVYRQIVNEDFTQRDTILRQAGIDLDAFSLSKTEKEALTFLYAYMPLGDILNHPVKFYLDNYRLTQLALKRMPWGKTIPEREVRHFILPVRVNNENLDESRVCFYEELAPRVKHLSMYDAVLEVNHWCHEKVIYMPTDSRTSSPLATIKTAYGRCGEESTLLVAALRSVGIPARQVYTPRWAHTDSNHAWVEAWVDGEWYFLGACEPEPVLNLGWFNAPASRGLLMHTNVFGNYDGPEEVVKKTPLYTEINVIENYAPKAARMDVLVKNADGSPAKDATVEFRIYNYSTFHPVVTKAVDKDAKAFLKAGLGDMMIYAHNGSKFGFSKATFGKDKELTIVLNKEKGSKFRHLKYEIIPPVEEAILPELTTEQIERNKERMAYEDSLRNAYVATFWTAERAEAFADSLLLPKDRVTEIMITSRGNYKEIEQFVREAVSKDSGERALDLLESVSKKDLMDTPKSVLDDHLYNTPDSVDVATVLCPRVFTELLSDFRGYLLKNVPLELSEAIKQDPANLVTWCTENLKILDEISLPYIQVRPDRVWETKLADKYSREIFFVAMCRTFGVSAWKDVVNGDVKYKNNGLEYTVDFDAKEQVVSPKGKLRLKYDEIPMLDDPKYSTHFTISRFENGSFKTLSYPRGATWSSMFKDAGEIDAGYYMLTSGSRMSGGNVCADAEFFTVEEGKTSTVELKVRDDASQIRVIGSFDSEAKYMKPVPSVQILESSKEQGNNLETQFVESSILATTGRGYFAVILADHGTEPTNHAFMDISVAAKELEAWGRPILVLFASQADYEKCKLEHYNFPATVSFGVDASEKIREEIAKEMKLNKSGHLPLVVVADTFNRVVFFSQGYTIGLGDELVQLSKSL